ncbi:MAG: TolC family protein, partial [Candidatus Sulfotelmatobacter sp.]
VKSAQTYLTLEESRYETGIDPYVDVLIAQTTVLSSMQTLNNLQVQEMTYAVALVQALGGGWDSSMLPKPAQVTQKPPRSDTTVQQD